MFCFYFFFCYYLILQDSYPDVRDGKRYLCSGGMYMHDCISLGFILSGLMKFALALGWHLEFFNFSHFYNGNKLT